MRIRDWEGVALIIGAGDIGRCISDYVIAASPNSFTKRAKSSKIIAKWRYYYNNEVILELTVYPNEWND